MTTTKEFLNGIELWAKRRPDVIALALVGSWANGTAKADSDIDLVILVQHPSVYLNDLEWPTQFGAVEKRTNEDWGLIQSVRIFFKSGPEVEFGFATIAWANIDPIDDGTREVVLDGIEVLYDPKRLLTSLLTQITGND